MSVSKSSLDIYVSVYDNVIRAHKKYSEKLKIENHLYYLLSSIKVSNSQLVLRPRYPYQLPLGKTTHYIIYQIL